MHSVKLSVKLYIAEQFIKFLIDGILELDNCTIKDETLRTINIEYSFTAWKGITIKFKNSI